MGVTLRPELLSLLSFLPVAAGFFVALIVFLLLALVSTSVSTSLSSLDVEGRIASDLGIVCLSTDL